MPLEYEYYAPPEPSPVTYTECESCGGHVRQFYACSNCTNCTECRALIPWHRAIDVRDGGVACRTCIERVYSLCSNCDSYVRDGDDCGCDDEYDSDDDDPCDCGCCPPRSGRSGQVYSYSYKPMPEFRGQGPLYLGPEIEVEVGHRADYAECVDYAVERLGDLGYLKQDGSLNSGFEIVCHPMAYDWAMEHFPWDMLTGLQQLGCETFPDHTGLHVHVSRAGFRSPCHQYRWMKFIYRNAAPVQRLARRRSSQWAAFSDSARADVKHYVKGGRGDRYQAVNPNNDATYELRMFASSLDATEVQAAFGFAAASVEYTRQLAYASIAKEGGWTWRAFSQWIADRPEFTSLAKQMELLTCAY